MCSSCRMVADPSPVLLDIQGLHISLPSGGELVRAIDMTVERGEFVALVGSSGSGKTLAALSVIGLLSPGVRAQGRIVFDGENLSALSASAMRAVRGGRIGTVFQEPMTSLNPWQRVGHQVAESLRLHSGLRGAATRARVRLLFEQMRLQDPDRCARAYPHELSGGQRQRVLIAMALANEPELLIADEPTTALDATVQQHLLQLIDEQRCQRDMAVLFISHDLGLVRHYADRLYVMHEGEIVESGPVRALFSSPRHPRTQALLAARVQRSDRVVPKVDGELLRVRDLSVTYPQRGFRKPPLLAVEDVSFALAQGEVLGIVGESGSGKSTLALALVQLLPHSGRISLRGRDWSGLPQSALRSLRSQLQIVFQDPFGSLSPRLRVGEIVAEGLRVHQPTAKDIGVRAVRALQQVGLDESAQWRYPHEFSGGQRQRIAIARALVLQPSLLILDEPTSALDVEVQVSFVGLLNELRHHHRLSYIFISHDLGLVRALADQVLVMRHGRVVELEPVDRLFNAPKHQYTRELIAAASPL